MTLNKLTDGSNVYHSGRFLAVVIDLMIYVVIVFIFSIPVFLYDFRHPDKFGSLTASPIGKSWQVYFSYIGTAYLYCKDSFNAQSIGKRIARLQIVDVKTQQPASVFKCFARNLSLILFPLDAVMMLINPARRLGDLIAGTMVASEKAPEKEEKPEIIKIITVFLSAYLFVWFASVIVGEITKRY